MPLDPYHEKMTVSGQVKKQLIVLWPHVYKTINGLFTILFTALSEMIRSALRAFKL